ncbi:MAG: glycine betaine ABC transporter substrate-binding protein, partial [Chloroflexota bacterium]
MLWVVMAVTLLLIVGCTGGGSAGNGADEGSSDNALVLAYDGWSGTYLPTYVVKQLLEEDLGYNAVVADQGTVPGAFQAVAEGRADIFTSGWFPSRDFTFSKYPQLAKLGLVYGGQARDAYEGWMVTNDLAQSYGIEHVRDLRDEAVASALDFDGDGDGDLIGCPTDWACARNNPEILSDYGLSGMYEIHTQDSERQLMESIQERFEQGEPLLFYMIQPVAFPEGFSVQGEARWLEGTNQYLPLSFDRVIVRSDFIARHPEVAMLLDNLKVPGSDITEAMSEITDEGANDETLERLASDWISENR